MRSRTIVGLVTLAVALCACGSGVSAPVDASDTVERATNDAHEGLSHDVGSDVTAADVAPSDASHLDVGLDSASFGDTGGDPGTTPGDGTIGFDASDVAAHDVASDLPPGGCASNGDCRVTQYCAFAPNTCSGIGVCAPRPTTCPTLCSYVCGCNGMTYCNECHAAEAGTSVASSGACVDSGADAGAGDCTSNADCASTDYCALAVGVCIGWGTCTPRPDICPSLFDPICACNGRTYGNACYAAVAGQNVRHTGRCP